MEGRAPDDFSALEGGMKVVECLPVYCSDVCSEDIEFVLGVDAVFKAVPLVSGGFTLHFVGCVGDAIVIPGGFHVNSE